MHDALKSSSGYHKELDEALNDEFLRRTLDTFAVAYRANREAVFKEVDEKALIKQIADAQGLRLSAHGRTVRSVQGRS
jgi:hypothetical protein